jgi:hypothetical protein
MAIEYATSLEVVDPGSRDPVPIERALCAM